MPASHPAVTYRRLRELFEAASAISLPARAAWLDAHVADAAERLALQRLLDADDREAGLLETPAIEHATRLSAEEPPQPEGMIGRRVGAFRLTQFIGQGGMSAVFLAQREEADFTQRAAVKLLRRGLYSDVEQRLFRRERQLLAVLDHPNIARLIDGGVTPEGVPYLVMEFVDGTPITEHAALHALDIRARMRLFVVVCRAVEAAHRALIVHRDIKPANILVSRDGVVKLLDFGIAKLLEEDADSATVAVFTPEYAAPEQLSNAPITTATDVYSLGVLLHELIVGVRPQGNPARRPSSVVAAESRTRTTVPEMGIAAHMLRGDVDNIVLKALETEPSRRYATAGSLADDVERFLANRPVAAHPPSRSYRAGKFVQRNLGPVIATALFAAAILACLGAALWQRNVALREASRATHEAARASTVRDFVLGVFDSAGAHAPQDQRPTPAALVDQARRRVLQDRSLDGDTRAQVLASLGEVDLSLSNFARAEESFSAAQRETGDSGERRRLRVLIDDARQRAGRNAEAAEDIAALLPGAQDAPTAVLTRALGVLAQAEMQLGRPDDAIAHRREAVDRAERQSGPHSIDALAARFELGGTLVEVQNYPAAITLLGAATTQWQSAHDVEDDRYVAALENLATAEDGTGDVAASENRYRDLLALKRRIFPEPHDAIARTLRALGLVVARREDYGQARTLIDQALQMDRRIFGDEHAQIVADYDALGEIEVAQRHFAAADDAYQTGLRICEHAGAKDDVCPRIRANYGMSLYRQGKLDEALNQMNSALRERRALFGNDHPSVAFSLAGLANLAVFQKRNADAVTLSAEALDVMQRSGRAASRDAALIRNTHAQALWVADRDDDALAEIDRALADWQRLAPDGRVRRVMMLVLKAQILAELKRRDEARATANEAIAMNVDPAQLSPVAKDVLRQLSGRPDVYTTATK